MSRHSIEQYLTEPFFAALGVLLGMGWYKLVGRRNRQFEPTLWWLFRWTFVFLTACGYMFATLDALIRLCHSYSIFFFG